MNPQVAFGAPDGWPAYSRTTHGTWELAGVLQDIQPKPRSHELCFSHVYMKTLGFQSLLPRLDTFNTFLKRSSNDHEIICKEQLPGHPHPKILLPVIPLSFYLCCSDNIPQIFQWRKSYSGNKQCLHYFLWSFSPMPSVFVRLSLPA